MKLNTAQIITLFQAHTALQGAPTVVLNERGQKAVIFEPYDMGPKFKWNAAKNRSILRRHVEAYEDAVQEFRAGLRRFSRELSSADDPNENAIKLKGEQERLDEEMRKLAKEMIDVEGLLKLPATGLNLKTSRIPPTVIEELMPLIDGEPDFPSEAQERKAS